MQLQCPCCGEQFPFEAGFADADGKVLAAHLATLDAKLGRAVLGYLRLFSPAKRGLRMTKAIRLLEELLALFNSGVVQKDARSAEARSVPMSAWLAGIEQMLNHPERLQIPLENHNYLRAVVWGIASEPAKVPAIAPQHSVSKTESLQEVIGRIEADLRLGLISKEDAENRRAKLARRSA